MVNTSRRATSMGAPSSASAATRLGPSTADCESTPTAASPALARPDQLVCAATLNSIVREHDGRVLAAEAEGVHLEDVDVDGSRLVQHDVEAHGWIEVRGAGHVG